jgi:parallel beta-helix repeat protein
MSAVGCVSKGVGLYFRGALREAGNKRKIDTGKPAMRYVTVTVALLACANPARAADVAVPPGPGAAERLAEALITARPGDTIWLGIGRYELADGLSLAVDDVSLRGIGPDVSVLSFAGQQGSGEGLLVTSNRVVLDGFAVENPKGDGIKSKGSDTITFSNLRVEWTGGPNEKNGAYGVYPVASRNVLIDGVTVRGASDAGIYVGQSQDIVVRNSLAEFNVAGIEIENSWRADVHGNVARHNTGGILVFDLPNLPQQGGRDIRVFANTVVDNDTDNFAPKGNTVAMVPRGLGIMVMANRNVHVFDNDLSGNATAHVLVAAYPNDYKDDKYLFVPRGVYVHDNRYGPGGNDPNGEVGDTISRVSGKPVPEVVWDGVTRLTEWVSWVDPENRVYVEEAEGVGVINLKMISQLLLPWSTAPDRNAANYRGSIAEPPAVRLPQDKEG